MRYISLIKSSRIQKIFSITTLIILSTLSVLTYAQQKIYPGKKTFEQKWLKADDYEMTWYALRDTQKIKIGTVNTQILVNKDVTVITEVNLIGRNSTWIDTTKAEKQTLKPIYHSSFNSNRDMALNFNKVVSGYYNDKSKNARQVIADTVTAPYFDSNIYPQLIRLLPLKEGFSAIIPIYDYNPEGKIGTVSAYIEKVESKIFTLPDKRQLAVWQVSVSDELGTGPKSSSIYVISKEERKLLKQEIIVGNRKMVMIRTK